MIAVLGWVAVAAMLGVGYVLYARAQTPTSGERVLSSRQREAGSYALDAVVNKGAPLPGQPDMRDARRVVENWLQAVGCVPYGSSIWGGGDYDLDIGGYEHRRDTESTHERGFLPTDGSVAAWYPNYERLAERVAAKMRSEFPGSDWRLNREKERRMDVRSCAWREFRREAGLPTNKGYANWRLAKQHGGSNDAGTLDREMAWALPPRPPIRESAAL